MEAPVIATPAPQDEYVLDFAAAILDGYCFRSIFEILKQITPVANLYFTPLGLEYFQIDKNNQLIAQLHISYRAFPDGYHITPASATSTPSLNGDSNGASLFTQCRAVGISLEELCLALKNSSKGKKAILYGYAKGPNHVVVPLLMVDVKDPAASETSQNATPLDCQNLPRCHPQAGFNQWKTQEDSYRLSVSLADFVGKCKAICDLSPEYSRWIMYDRGLSIETVNVKPPRRVDMGQGTTHPRYTIKVSLNTMKLLSKMNKLAKPGLVLIHSCDEPIVHLNFKFGLFILAELDFSLRDAEPK